MASLPFQKIPKLPTLGGNLGQQSWTPPKMDNGLPLDPQGKIKNTNPFKMNPRRFQRREDEQSRRDELYKGLDKNMQEEFKLLGEGTKNRYLELLRVGGQPDEEGLTEAQKFLNFVRMRREEEQAKWKPIYEALDDDTRNAYNVFDMDSQNAYRQAMIVGEGLVDLVVDGQTVRLKGTQAAKEIYGWAREFAAKRLQQKKDLRQQQLYKQTPFRLSVG